MPPREGLDDYWPESGAINQAKQVLGGLTHEYQIAA
jgi:hypothetical protein